MITIRSFVVCVVAALLLPFWSPFAASAQPSQPFQVLPQPGGVAISWSGTVSVDSSGAAHVAGWSTQSIDGALLPVQFVALRAPDGTQIAPRVEQVLNQPWRGSIRHVQSITPRPVGGEERPDLATNQLILPTSPVSLAREGHVRGVRVVVLAITPVFAQSGVVRAATSLRVTVPGVMPLTERASDLLSSSAPFIANVAPPTNSASATQAWIVHVTRAGMQELSVSALAASGVDLSDPARLHLRKMGQEVSMEEVRDGNGTLSALRFYAAPPGDRWNAADSYWLTLESTPGSRMGVRDVTAGSAPAQTIALERGTWRESRLYDSSMPGPGGDHWFSADLKTGPDQPAAQFSATLTPTLPLASGTTTLTVTGAAYTRSQHQLQVTMGSAQAGAIWTGSGNWTKVLTFSDNVAQITGALVPGAVYDGVELDSMSWERPVALDFGGRGAQFVGLAGTWRYQLANVPAGAALYDVSNPLAPARLTMPTSATQFQDGPEQHTYLLAGPGTLQTPAISAQTPVDLSAPLNADVLYIAPAAFHGALVPLVARRGAQGYTVRIVDVQAIYNAWSYGQVAPEAIRSFLRYAASTWSRAPMAVLLVGDGTSDPLNYTRHNNTNFIPPYLAMVDPWIGETACETCYAQLDGDQPQTGWSGDVMPDLMIGRLPVKSADELTAVVAKIIGYETATSGQFWQSQNVYVADNADQAGDFAAFADASAALQPAGVSIERIYYDPNSKDDTAGRIADPLVAHQQAMAAIESGAGLVNYAGHGNQFQWAVTGPPLQAGQPDDQQYLLNSNDVGNLTNSNRLPIVLEMTCLTSAFQVPAYSGMSIGERFVVNPHGGAAAVWGPTGYGVEHGHDALQAGFYGALWAGSDRRLGTLTTAGYLRLFGSGSFPETIRTYVLLGDPLTSAQVSTGMRLHLPLVQGK
jgi:hypothetical protein